MNIAIVGCGYVADFYVRSLRYHPELTLVGAHDRDEDRLKRFCAWSSTRAYGTLEEMLDDSGVHMVLNLTNPRSHAEITRACIHAGKHVYTEKPLAMDVETGRALVALAQERGVWLAGAPCSVLGETAQTMWKAIRDGAVGPVRLVYASFDAGMMSRARPETWRSESGAPFPLRDEYEIGCTYEHAGYLLTWLAAFFGGAKRVTSFASCQVPDKGVPVDAMAPDFSVACIEYPGGVVARVTNSVVAPLDRSLTVIGEEGILTTKDVRDDASPVYRSATPSDRLDAALELRFDRWGNRGERLLNRIPWRWGNSRLIRRRVPFYRAPQVRTSGRNKPVDFCRGPAELAESIEQKRPCRLSPELALHVAELVEAMQWPERFGGRKEIQTTIEAMAPLF